jgi:hypothetical protein
MEFSSLNNSLFFTTGADESNGSEPTMEVTITSKQQILISRDEILSGWPLPFRMDHPIFAYMILFFREPFAISDFVVVMLSLSCATTPLGRI